MTPKAEACYLRERAAELAAVYENLTATQVRCTELLEEKRALSAEVARYRYRNAELEKAMLEELARIGQEAEEVPFEALNVISDHVHAIACSKGWYDEQVTIADFCANMHGEISEVWETFRRGTMSKQCDKETPEPLDSASEEWADCLIRLCDMAAYLGIDIGRAVRIKSAYNETRPYRHGGLKA